MTKKEFRTSVKKLSEYIPVPVPVPVPMPIEQHVAVNYFSSTMSAMPAAMLPYDENSLSF